MIGAEIGRVLVSTIHQAIGDEIPTRSEFYEHWLGGDRLRGGGVGLAPMTAVIGFLRTEGPPYHAVMRRAGQYAADWTVDSMPAFRRRAILALPRWWRVRTALKLAAQTIRQGYEPTKTKARVRRGQARLEVKNSLFCRVREPQAEPLCDFQAALIVQMLKRFNVPATFRIDTCIASGGNTCAVVVDLTPASAARAAETLP